MRLGRDSESGIFLAKNSTYHSKMKHINVHHHFVRDMVEDKKVLIEKVDTLNNVVDSLIKSMSTENFFCCIKVVGIATLDK